MTGLSLPNFDTYEIPNATDYAALLERARERRRRADDEAAVALLMAKLAEEDGGDDGGNGSYDPAGA